MSDFRAAKIASFCVGLQYPDNLFYINILKTNSC